MTAEPTAFYDWLIRQRHRGDGVGLVAQTAVESPAWQENVTGWSSLNMRSLRDVRPPDGLNQSKLVGMARHAWFQYEETMREDEP